METMEVKNKLMDLYIQNMRKAVELIDSVFIPTIKDFDNKVFNARLENTLKKKLEGKEAKDNIYCSVELNYRKCAIEVHFFNHRSVFYEEKLWNSEEKQQRIAYLPDGMVDITICSIYSDFNQYDSEKNASYNKYNEEHYFYIGEYPSYNTRICSKAIVKELEDKKAYLLKRIEELEHAKTLQAGFDDTLVEAWIDELETIKRQLETLNHAVPWEIKSIYDIKTYANWY